MPRYPILTYDKAQGGIAGFPIVRAQSLGSFGSYATTGGIGVTGATGGPAGGHTTGLGGGESGGPSATTTTTNWSKMGPTTRTQAPLAPTNPSAPPNWTLHNAMKSVTDAYTNAPTWAKVGLGTPGLFGNFLASTLGLAAISGEGYTGEGSPGGQLIDTRYRDFPQGNFPESVYLGDEIVTQSPGPGPGQGALIYQEDEMETNLEDRLMPIVTAQKGFPTIRAQGGLGGGGLGGLLLQLSPEFRKLFESQRGSGETFDPTQPTLVNRGFVGAPSDYQHGIMDQWNYYPESGQGTIAEIPRVDPATGAGVATSPADADLLASAGIPNLAAKHGYNPSLPTVKKFMGGLFEGSSTAYPEDGGSAPSGGGSFGGGLVSMLMNNPKILGLLEEEEKRRAGGPINLGGTLPAVPMNTGGMIQDAMRLQAAGSGPHNQLVHMTQGEVDAMNALAGSGIGGLRSNGMAINPQTGLPEAGFFSSILPALAGIGLTIASGGTAAPWALGLASGAGSLVGQKLEGGEVDVGKAFLAGLGGWGAGQLGRTFGAAGAELGAGGAANIGVEQAAVEAGKMGAEPFSQALTSTATRPWAQLGGGLPVDAAGRALTSVGASGTPGYLSTLAQGVPPEQLTNIGALYGTGGSDAALQELAKQSYLGSTDKIGLIKSGLGTLDPTQWGSAAGTVGLKEVLAPGAALAASTADAFGAFDQPEYKYPEDPLDTYDYQGPYLPRPRTAFAPPEGYQPGIDPAYQYFSYGNRGGYVGGLPTIRAITGYGQQQQPKSSPATDMLAAAGAANTGLGAIAQPKGLGFYTTDPRMALRNLAQAQARPQQVAPVPREDPLLAGQRQPTLPGQMPGQQMFARNGGYASDLPTVRMEGGVDSLEPPPGTKWHGLRDYMHPDRPPTSRRTGMGGWAPRPPRQDRGTDYEDIKRSVLRNMLTSRSARDLQKLGSSVTGPEQVPMYHPDYGYRVYNRPESEGGVPEQRWKYAWNKKQYGGIAGLPTVRMAGEPILEINPMMPAEPWTRGGWAGRAVTGLGRENIPSESVKGYLGLLGLGGVLGGVDKYQDWKKEEAQGPKEFEGTTDQRRAKLASDEKLELAEDARKNKEALERAEGVNREKKELYDQDDLNEEQYERFLAAFPDWRTLFNSREMDRSVMQEHVLHDVITTLKDTKGWRADLTSEEVRSTARFGGPGNRQGVGEIPDTTGLAYEEWNDRSPPGQFYFPDRPNLWGDMGQHIEVPKSAPQYIENVPPGADIGEVKKQVGGVAGEPVDIATSGLMGGAAPEIQAAVAERDMVTPAPDQPQNAEERAVFDQALLALQGELEPEPAQAAITEFIDTFGPEAFRQLQALVSGERENGGLVQPANGETTVGMTEEEAMAQQGPDVIPGKIVDPTTGKQTANLLVGENEYIEPADSLSRRAMAAGMAGTPQNGAIVRGREEEQLRRAYG